jgi:hypothetical protein
VTYPRSQVVDFTFSFSDDPMALLIPFPQLESTISAIAKPFQHEAKMSYVIHLIDKILK